jgi:hypothetical protein
MDARSYNSLLNVTMYGFGTALNNLVDLNMVRLVVRQFGEAMVNSEYGPKFLQSLGFEDPKGKDVKSIVDGYAEQFKKVGITNVFEVVEASDEKLVMDIGMCVFASATAAFRAEGVELPPCPIVGIICAGLNKKLGVNGRIVAAEYNADANSTLFTVDLFSKQ